MKKKLIILTIVLIVVIIAIVFYIGGLHSNETTDSEINSVQKAVETYYTNLYSLNDQLPSFPYELSRDCEVYLGNKYNYELSVLRKNNVANIIELNTTIEKQKTADNYTIYWVVASFNFGYSDASGSGYLVETTQIVLNHSQKFQIVDWYNGEPGTYESELRGSNLDLSDSTNLIENHMELIER